MYIVTSTHIYTYIYIHTNKIYGFEVQRTKAAGSPLAARMKALKADSAKQAGGEGFGLRSLVFKPGYKYKYIYIERVTECRPVFFE